MIAKPPAKPVDLVDKKRNDMLVEQARAKLAKSGITQEDIADAIRWARRQKDAEDAAAATNSANPTPIHITNAIRQVRRQIDAKKAAAANSANTNSTRQKPLAYCS